jgi:predicted NUDIX family NTP pyrophosphohydrolase
MVKQSAGLLAYRLTEGRLEVFLVHMGGPLWARKDHWSWSIPKGEIEQGEDPLQAAKREFIEETGFNLPDAPFLELTPRKSSGKVVYVWAFAGDFDPDALRSNTFTMEWPPKSGQFRSFPENDRAGWFSVEQALTKIVKGQKGFVEELAERMEDPATRAI